SLGRRVTSHERIVAGCARTYVDEIRDLAFVQARSVAESEPFDAVLWIAQPVSDCHPIGRIHVYNQISTRPVRSDRVGCNSRPENQFIARAVVPLPVAEERLVNYDILTIAQVEVVGIRRDLSVQSVVPRATMEASDVSTVSA